MNLSASIMMVLEGCSATKDHLFLINTLMQLKKDVCLVSLGVRWGRVGLRVVWRV